MSEDTNKVPLLAIDTVIFAVVKDKLKVLLIQIKDGIYHEKWAVPGGLVKINESLDQAVARVLHMKTNIRDIHLEQLYTFGDPKRDKRKRSITVAYFALISNPEKFSLRTLEYYKDIDWFNIANLPSMAFDHKNIIEMAHDRLKSKLSYSNIAYSLLPKKFTLTQMQRVYEVIYGEKLDKRNFRKSVIAKGLVKKTGSLQTAVLHRPAQLFKFSKRSFEIINV